MTKAPFTDDQCESVNAYQKAGIFHPFTCVDDGEVLEAMPKGLRCPKCGHPQDWVHDFMANWTWKPPDERSFALPEDPEK